MQRAIRLLSILIILALVLLACGGAEAPPTNTPAPAPTNTPVPPADTPVPPTATPIPPTEPPPTNTPEAAAEPEPVAAADEIPGAATHAVDLIAAWVEAGVPESDPFDYLGNDGNTYQAVFATDIQPLFTEANIWFQGAPSCISCHHDNLENAYHEMSLATHEGLMAGGDRLSEPPGVPLFGQSEIGATDYDWSSSKIRERLRNNRMPPGMPFDITEANRDGPPIQVGGTEVMAVDLIAAWVEAGAPESDPFGDYQATFEADVLPLFAEPGLWYADAPSCTSCHHGNLENAYHEMDLSSYEGIVAGGDRLSEPPGVPLLGQSEIGATDYDWSNSKLRGRLRNNRMPPGMPFDITEANRDGPLVWRGQAYRIDTDIVSEDEATMAADLDIDLTSPPSVDEVTPLITKGGCIACHTIPGVAGAVGQLGPPWCEVTEEFKAGEINLGFILQSIVDPNAEVEESYPSNLMPQTFGELFSEEELQSLVAFIATLDCQ